MCADMRADFQILVLKSGIMKQLNYSLFCLLCGGLVFTACKKGTDDPFLSLLSRKARIAGDWEMTNYAYYSESYPVSGGDTNRITETGTSEIIETTINYYFYKTTQTKTLTDYSLSITKDGAWHQTIEYQLLSEYQEVPDLWVLQGHYVELRSGTWSFVNKDGASYENKERVLFNTLSETTTHGELTQTHDYNDPGTADETSTLAAESSTITYLDGSNQEVYDLTLLKNHEMHWQKVSGFTSGSYVVNETRTLAWQQK